MSEEPTGPSYRFVPAARVDAGWLVLEQIQPSDAADLYQAVSASMDHLRQWMAWAEGYTPASAEQFVARNTAPAEDASVTDALYVARNHAGHFLGMLGLHARLGENHLEISYWVDVRYTRLGVATLGSAALTELAIGIPGLTAVEIHHDQANVASSAIPAKLGYEHVATVDDTPEGPGEIRIEWQWRMTPAAWPTSLGARLLTTARAAAR